ncbi:MAG: methyltransferase [Candidatus Margulisbacteria bacterium GWF2_35_9]|nr:MAG: methyltransferase [Candidatus Margulisbacteria bacterium GWF2_35_9]
MINNYLELYKVQKLPIYQNRMYDSENEARACPKGDVCLVENLETGLVYNTAFCPELMVYDAHYQNEQAVSSLFLEHLKSVAKIVGRSMGLDGLVEVGCGKGYFLEMLLSQGFDIIGFDPAYEGTNARIERCYFKPGMGIKAANIILRHVLEHIQDPVNFLMHLREANGGSGLIYIEVPCFNWICSHRAYFDVFYEHVNYFRLADFYRIFGRVIEAGRLFGGQYLYIVADLTSLKIPQYDMQHPVNFPEDFLHCFEELRRTEHITIWGGASKGVILALLKEYAGTPVKTVIDINPAKQGKFLPATGLKVQSPAEALQNFPLGGIIYIMNSNYREEIKEMTGNIFNLMCIDHE